MEKSSSSIAPKRVRLKSVAHPPMIANTTDMSNTPCVAHSFSQYSNGTFRRSGATALRFLEARNLQAEQAKCSLNIVCEMCSPILLWAFSKEGTCACACESIAM
mmetsp:Transcript_42708/g.68188  ORF Transcript_42708/g.68188 Transcript_42708/m.68188 type:complete len:104 (+) Transcript_42708:162-473(+)